VKPPRVLGPILCKSTTFDPATGATTLFGAFNALFHSSWPTPPEQFTVYAGLHGGVGEGTIELAVYRLETEERIHRYQRWFAVPDPSIVLTLDLRVRRCIFPAPGRYALRLRFDGVEAALTLLDLRARSRLP
jgi:hypothetical protein